MSGPRIVFFTSHPAHRKTASRVDEFAAMGAELELLAYDRQSLKDPGLVDTAFRSLGPSADGKLLDRAVRMPGAIARAKQHCREIGACDVIWVNSMDLLAIALAARDEMSGPRKVVFDNADLRPQQTSPGATGKVFRAIERRLLGHVDMLVLTSPWFYWRYYRELMPKPIPVHLYENKISPPLPPRAAARQGPPWRIVWHGLLRSRQSFEVLRALAERLPDTIEVEAWGMCLEFPDDLEAAGRALPNFHVRGKYSDAAIDPIFEGAHFIFAFDLDDGENSWLLLPNRLYHAVARALPALAADGSGIAKVLDHHKAGLSVAEPYLETLTAFFKGLDAAGYERLRGGVADDLRARAVYGDELHDLIRNLMAGRPHPGALPPEEDVSFVLPPAPPRT